MALTSKYLSDHRVKLHSSDSFARALAERVLREAEAKLEERGVAPTGNVIEIPARIFVSEVEVAGCVQVCVNIGGATVCYHVG